MTIAEHCTAWSQIRRQYFNHLVVQELAKDILALIERGGLPMTEGSTCPKCQADLSATDAVAMGRCRNCGWDLSLPDQMARQKKGNLPPDPRRYKGAGRKR